MKKIKLLTIIILICGLSCKKSSDSSAPTNTISATIDGVTETFNTNSSAHISTASTNVLSALDIIGTDGSATGANYILLRIQLNAPISTGTYDNSTTPGVATILFSVGTASSAQPNSYSTISIGNSSGTIVITSLTSNNIEGTFTGKLISTNGNTSKTITDGKFNLALK